MCKRKSSENKENESFSYEPSKKTRKEAAIDDKSIETVMERELPIKFFINLLNKQVRNENINLMSIINRMTELESTPWPFAITLDNVYSQESLAKKGDYSLLGIDKERFEILKKACSNLNFSIVKVTLKIEETVDWNPWWGNRWGRDAFVCHDDDYSDDDDSEAEEYNHDDDVEHKILSRKQEEDILDDAQEGYTKSKLIEFWLDSNGVCMLENNSNIAVEFFSKIIDLKTHSDGIDSWIYQKRFHEYIGKGYATLSTIYEKDLLVFYPKEFDFIIMSNLNLERAINMINKNDQKINIDKFFPSIRINVNNIKQNCLLAQKLLKLKQYEAGLACLEKCVIPILYNSNEFKNCFHSFHKISETLFLFGREKELIKFKDLILTHLTIDQLQILLEEYLKSKKCNRSRLHTCKPIVDLFNYMINYFLHNEPINDWKMDRGNVSSLEVAEFLESNKQQMTYRGEDEPKGHFYSIIQARKFANLYSSFNESYSIQCEAFKIKKDKPFVTITKTLEYFQMIKKQYTNKIEYFQSFLKT